MATLAPLTAVKTANPRIVPLKIEDKSTWRNVACPVDLTALQAELTKKGGVIDGYGFSGKPKFIIVWGQEYQNYVLGKQRLMFPDNNIEAIHRTNHFAVTPEVYERAIAWLSAENTRRKDAFMNLNFKEFQNFPNFTEYLKNHESPLNYFRLSPDANEARIAAMLPPSWRYLRGLYDYEEIGQQCFFVLQWMPPEYFGSESAWASLRFDKVYYPETDTEEFIDICGEFPYRGKYEHVVLRIGTKQSEDFYNYKTPTFENVITPLQALLRITQNTPESHKTKEYQSEAAFKRARAKQAAETKRFRSDFHERFTEATPVGKGAPTNISANKNKVR